jgi:PAS domain S-box-containing protein
MTISNTNKYSISGITPFISSVFMLVFLAVSLWLIIQYVEKERDRDLANWQSRLALLAEIRAKNIESWVEGRVEELNYLANNSSLRLFLSQQGDKNSIDSSIISAQQGHVRNLIIMSAVQFDLSEFSKNKKQLNLNKQSNYGLAVLGMEQQLVMSTKGFPVDLGRHKEILKKTYESAKTQIIDLYSAKNHMPVYGYVAPVFKIQDTNKTSPVGAVMALLDPQDKLYELLLNRQSATKTDESILVRQSGPSIVYVSPINSEIKLFHRLPDNNNRLAASNAFHNVGSFLEMKDYRGDNVLITARKVKNTPWRLVQKISSDEALEESNKHQKFLLTTFTVFVLFVSAVFVAIWRHATSVRLKELSDVLEERTILLDAVTDNIQENIVLTDKESKIIFINPSFANMLSLESEELKEKHLASVVGVETARQLEKSVCSEKGACVLPLNVNDNKYIYHITSATLAFGKHKNARLFVLHDISELKQEQEKREKLGRGIIGTLIKAVDLHDPFCANHSERTREVALEIAKALSLSEDKLESLSMAALLANIGKLFIPKSVLTKMEPLSAEESEQMRMHIEYAVDILSGLEFTGPVIEIIAQKNERMDGSGYPKGLAGEQILIESRILAVANAFVAMASSRAYREGREVTEVVNILLEQSESEYDRHIVAALFHIAENKSNWNTWKSVEVSQ